jgi:hypothetical protein
MTKGTRVHFVVSGDAVTPARVSVRDLAQDLADLDKAIRAQAGASEGEPMIALVEVKAGSADYVLMLAEKAVEPYGAMLRAIADGESERLDDDAVTAVSAIAKRHRSKGRRAKLGSNKRAKAPAVEITTDHPVDRPTPQKPTRSLTTLYGRVVGVRLKDPSGATCAITSTFDGTLVKCVTTTALGLRLGRRLGEEVAVSGEQRRAADTDEVIGFVIEEILPYERKPMSVAIDEGRRRVGDLFKGTTSDEFIEEMRGE